MDYNYLSSLYLTNVSAAVLALSNMSCCELDPEQRQKILSSMLELEQSTADFITGLKLNAAGAKICKEGFIYANDTAIRHLQKIQSQSCNFDEYVTALKLETKTLKEELNSL